MFKSKSLVVAGFLSILSSQHILAEGVHALSGETLAKARNGWSRPQSWNCGPRAVSMSLAMLDSAKQDIAGFVNSCPRTLGSPQCEKTKALQNEILEKNKESAFLLKFALSAIEIGPFAECLASYVHNSQSNFDVFNERYLSFDGMLSAMIREIDSERPVIAKIRVENVFLHYLIVVAVDEDRKEITILNSENRSTKVHSYEDFESMVNLNAYHSNLLKTVDDIQESFDFVNLGHLYKKLNEGDVRGMLSGYNLIQFSPRFKDEV